MAMRMRFIFLCLFAPIAIGDARAAEDCNPHGDAWAVGSVSAKCKDKGQCVVTIASESGTAKSGDRLTMARPGPSAVWTIQLHSEARGADYSDGFNLIVDSHAPMRIAGEFLDIEKSSGDVSIDPRLTSIVAGEMMEGRKLLWEFATAPGGQKTVPFTLKGLKKVVAWTTCKQSP